MHAQSPRRASLLSRWAVVRAAFAPPLWHSFAVHCFIFEREGERVTAVPLDPASLVERSANAFLAGKRPKRRANLLNRTEKTSCTRTTSTHIIPRSRSVRVIHSKSFNPIVAAFPLIAFSSRSYYVNCSR